MCVLPSNALPLKSSLQILCLHADWDVNFSLCGLQHSEANGQSAANNLLILRVAVACSMRSLAGASAASVTTALCNKLAGINHCTESVAKCPEDGNTTGVQIKHSEGGSGVLGD